MEMESPMNTAWSKNEVGPSSSEAGTRAVKVMSLYLS